MNKKSIVSAEALLEKKDQEIAKLKALIEKNICQHTQEIETIRAYYENILGLMPGHVYWLNRDNVYLGCNDLQAKQANLNSRKEIVGKRNQDLPWSKYAETLDAFNNEVMATGIPHSKVEHAFMANGEGVYFSQKVPLRDKHDQIIGLLGISIDITELKKAEAALMIAKKHAEDSNRAKIEFIANMSHDIRTPLSGVVGLSKLLTLSLNTPEYKQYAQWINESGEQLLSLLNSVLDVASAENMNEDDIHYEVFDLRQCINEIVALERPTTELKGLALNVYLDDDVPAYIKSDRVKLHRILLNLLGNAIKFTQHGHVTIDIDVCALEEEKVQLQFSVIDSGIGILFENQPKVFDRFFRESASYDGIYSGYGVGLNIARSYVELLKGELNLSSTPGVGTTFCFKLWVNISDDINANLPSEESLTLAVESLPELELSSTLMNSRIQYVPHLLLVEDNVIALRMAEVIAVQAGCRFTSALNSEKALELVEKIDFDLIISDVGLPGFSGDVLAFKIRELLCSQHKFPVPIVGLTAHADAKIKNLCFQAGMNDVFNKPINLQMMHEILSRFIPAFKNKTDDTICHIRQDLPNNVEDLFDLNQFPLLDIEYALQRLGTDALLQNMLRIMIEQVLPEEEIAIKKAYENNDWTLVENIAHKMKSGAVYCGTFKLQYACQYLERYRKKGYTDLLEKLYTQLLAVIQETKIIITQLISA